MQYNENKLRLNEKVSAIQDFQFLVKFGLVLVYILKVYREKSSSILLRKKYVQFITCIFLLKKCFFSSLKDFSAETLETTPSTFLPKFSCEICLSQSIKYWDSIFTSYLTWEAFSLVCVLPVFLFFFFLHFFLFLLVFSLRGTNNSQDSREGRRNHYFPSFQPPPANEHSFGSFRFILLILLKLIVITRLIADETYFSQRFAFYLHCY